MFICSCVAWSYWHLFCNRNGTEIIFVSVCVCVYDRVCVFACDCVCACDDVRNLKFCQMWRHFECLHMKKSEIYHVLLRLARKIGPQIVYVEKNQKYAVWWHADWYPVGTVSDFELDLCVCVSIIFVPTDPGVGSHLACNLISDLLVTHTKSHLCYLCYHTLVLLTPNSGNCYHTSV